MNRFKTNNERKQILDGLKDGQIDARPPAGNVAPYDTAYFSGVKGGTGFSGSGNNIWIKRLSNVIERNFLCFRHYSHNSFGTTESSKDFNTEITFASSLSVKELDDGSDTIVPVNP